MYGNAWRFAGSRGQAAAASCTMRHRPRRNCVIRAFRRCLIGLVGAAVTISATAAPGDSRTMKPPLHGQHWMAITGKPLGATAGAMTFQKGGNAVDAACAMIAASATIWDTMSWGGE